MINRKYFVHCLLLGWLLVAIHADVQSQSNWWHGIERRVHYMPDGEDFLLVNGGRRFNRALYGGHTAFRVEAGDLPEFALYLPGMGGNLKFGIISKGESKWLINADKIETRYRPGSMIYSIRDRLLGQGRMTITVLAGFESESLLIRVQSENLGNDVQLIAAYGGVTGQKFSRDGDIGADPESSFDLQPDYCRDDSFSINKNQFRVFFGRKRALTEEERYEIQNFPSTRKDTVSAASSIRSISGIFPAGAVLKLSEATSQQSPAEFWQSAALTSPAVCAAIKLAGGSDYFLIQNVSTGMLGYEDLPFLFQKTEQAREQLAGRIKVSTPDPYINTIGGALSVAADAIWEPPSYLHGAVAWRMRLNGWRGAYVADLLGWHDRAEMHFSSYALSQVLSPASGPVVMDTALHLARGLEKLGTSLFSSGYISRNPDGDIRPHHYDMNLVFIDQLLNHFCWTGDTGYLRKMWPVLTRHLDWEKRNFDRDGDGLYDAYAAIWASDALQYSGGGVTHSSAYNFRANAMAADLAKIIGLNGNPYKKEADKISRSMNTSLWLPKKGWFAEYKDLLGKKLVHPSAGLWTVYHAIDSHLPDAFQSYQMLRYIDNEIPHIPIRAEGLKDSTLYTLSTTNWQPYTWSLNNVALAELLHTSLAYWQGGRNEEAFDLWKSSLVESMYLGASPANFQQLSFYDAMRGELYRDFGDDIGMASRSLIEGLFGIEPDLLHGRLCIQPGFPHSWDHASIKTPDIDYSFQRRSGSDYYQINTHFTRPVTLVLAVRAATDSVQYVICNGKRMNWSYKDNSVGSPTLVLSAPFSNSFQIEIVWKGRPIEHFPAFIKATTSGFIDLNGHDARFTGLFDPEQALERPVINEKHFRARVTATGNHTFFIKARQGNAGFWIPVSINAVEKEEVRITKMSGNEKSTFVQLANLTGHSVRCRLQFNYSNETLFTVKPKGLFSQFGVIGPGLIAGTNHIELQSGIRSYSTSFVDWNIINPVSVTYDKIDLGHYFNEEVNNIFNNRYLNPRPHTTTLELPVQGIGNWAYPLTMATISDSGLRKRAGAGNEIIIRQGIPFCTPSRADSRNIIFTSQWDNYPSQITIPLSGTSSHAYFLMAGTTNPMQSRMVNGRILVEYEDGSRDSLELSNPENWWPIEQDYYEDGYAFTTDAPRPIRVYLKTGRDSGSPDHYISIKGYSSRGIDGGAATVLDMPLHQMKKLKALRLETVANDVIIGLMSVTLIR